MNSTETSAEVIPVAAVQSMIPESKASAKSTVIHIVANAAGAILILGLGDNWLHVLRSQCPKFRRTLEAGRRQMWLHWSTSPK